MLRKFMTSLSNPSMAIFFAKDAWSKIFLYIFLLPFFLILPGIIVLSVQPTMAVYMYEDISNAMLTEFRFDDVTLDDYTLTYGETKTIELQNFNISMGEIISPYMVTFNFETDGIGVYLAAQQLDFMTYQELNFRTHDFTSTKSEDISQISIALKDVYEQQTFLFAFDMIVQYFIYVVDFLVVIFIMTLLSSLLSPMIRIPFKIRFKMSTYISTIYIFSNFVLILLGLYSLNAISMILVYGYHFWAYRKIKIFPKGEAPNV